MGLSSFGSLDSPLMYIFAAAAGASAAAADSPSPSPAPLPQITIISNIIALTVKNTRQLYVNLPRLAVTSTTVRVAALTAQITVQPKNGALTWGPRNQVDRMAVYTPNKGFQSSVGKDSFSFVLRGSGLADSKQIDSKQRMMPHTSCIGFGCSAYAAGGARCCLSCTFFFVTEGSCILICVPAPEILQHIVLNLSSSCYRAR
jgi:hypothetical protein